MTFSFVDLFQATWGYRPQAIQLTDPDGSKNFRVTDGGDFKFKDVNQKSKKGKYGDYYKADLMGRMVFMPVTLGGLFLPYSWISISGSKKIVETPMTERRGEVNEIISAEDYKISLKGFVIGQNGNFPEADIEDLKTLFEKQQSVELDCILSDIFLLSTEHGGQDKVIIKTFDMPEMPGVEHVRAFAMELKTDQIFTLEIA
jgi:hypothetical protein